MPRTTRRRRWRRRWWWWLWWKIELIRNAVCRRKELGRWKIWVKTIRWSKSCRSLHSAGQKTFPSPVVKNGSRKTREKRNKKDFPFVSSAPYSFFSNYIFDRIPLFLSLSSFSFFTFRANFVPFGNGVQSLTSIYLDSATILWQWRKNFQRITKSFAGYCEISFRKCSLPWMIKQWGTVVIMRGGIVGEIITNALNCEMRFYCPADWNSSCEALAIFLYRCVNESRLLIPRNPCDLIYFYLLIPRGVVASERVISV